MRTETDRMIVEAREQLWTTAAEPPLRRHYVMYEDIRCEADAWEMRGEELYLEFEIKVLGGSVFVPLDLELTLMRSSLPAIEEPFPVTLERSYTLSDKETLRIDLLLDAPVDLRANLRSAVWGNLTADHER